MSWFCAGGERGTGKGRERGGGRESGRVKGGIDREEK